MIARLLAPLAAMALALALAGSGLAGELAAARPDKAADMVEEFMKDYDRTQADRPRPERLEPTALAAGALGGSRESLAMLANLRDVLGLPKLELSAGEIAGLERLTAFMPKLAGTSGRFDRADLEPIIKSLEEDLEQEVGREIVRQASADVQPGTFGESLRRRAVAAHLERHGEAYLQHGMEEARRRVRHGFIEFFQESGTASAAPEPGDARRISLDEIKEFSKDVRVLQVISRRSAERGLPRFSFPNGMSAEDLRAIRAGELPPNGQVLPRY